MSWIFSTTRGLVSTPTSSTSIRHSCLSCSASRQATALTVSRPDETESALLDLVDDELRPAQRLRHPKRLACASVFDCNNLAVNATPRCHQDSKRSIGESSAGANTFVAMCPAFLLRRNEEDHPHEIIRLSGGMHSLFMQVKEVEYVEVEEFQINFVIQLGQAWWLNHPMLSPIPEQVARASHTWMPSRSCEALATRCRTAQCDLHNTSFGSRSFWRHNRLETERTRQRWPEPRISGQVDRDCIDLSSREEAWKARWTPATRSVHHS